MRLLTKTEEVRMRQEQTNSYNKGYNEGIIKGRALAHEEDYLQDVSFADVEFVFDFHHPDINVFSIERAIAFNGKETEQTVIGYTMKSEPGLVKQWYFQCSRSHHNKLVSQWNESKRSPFVRKK